MPAAQYYCHHRYEHHCAPLRLFVILSPFTNASYLQKPLRCNCMSAHSVHSRPVHKPRNHFAGFFLLFVHPTRAVRPVDARPPSPFHIIQLLAICDVLRRVRAGEALNRCPRPARLPTEGHSERAREHENADAVQCVAPPTIQLQQPIAY